MKVEWIEQEQPEPIYEMVRKRKAIKPEVIEYAGFEAVDQMQLARVRGELTALPNITLVLNGDSPVANEAKPQTLGEAFVRWILGGVGLLVMTAGRVIEATDRAA